MLENVSCTEACVLSKTHCIWVVCIYIVFCDWKKIQGSGNDATGLTSLDITQDFSFSSSECCCMASAFLNQRVDKALLRTIAWSNKTISKQQRLWPVFLAVNQTWCGWVVLVLLHPAKRQCEPGCRTMLGTSEEFILHMPKSAQCINSSFTSRWLRLLLSWALTPLFKILRFSAIFLWPFNELKSTYPAKQVFTTLSWAHHVFLFLLLKLLCSCFRHQLRFWFWR